MRLSPLPRPPLPCRTLRWFVRPSRLLWACQKPLTVGCSGRRRRCRRSTRTLARSCAGLRNLRLLAQHGGMVANTGGGAGRRSRCVGLKACGPLNSVPVWLKRVVVARCTQQVGAHLHSDAHRCATGLALFMSPGKAVLRARSERLLGVRAAGCWMACLELRVFGGMPRFFAGSSASQRLGGPA